MAKKQRPAVDAIPDAADPELAAARDRQLAELAHNPVVRNASAAIGFSRSLLGGKAPTLEDSVGVFADQSRKVVEGDLSSVKAMLSSQAQALDAMFTDFARRSSANLGEYPAAAERYMRLALKAQANCRVTVEALAKIVGGGEQTIKHVHIDNRGGQAVVADTVQTGGLNEKSGGQPFGAGTVVRGPALLGQDATGYGMPIPCDAEREVSHPRGEVTWCSSGDPECLEARRPIGGDHGGGPAAPGYGTRSRSDG
jgi:hypothetical protein